MPVRIDRYGNAGAATIPLTICDHNARDGDASISQTISACGFGIGLSFRGGCACAEGHLGVSRCEAAQASSKTTYTTRTTRSGAWSMPSRAQAMDVEIFGVGGLGR
jgi:hypothetical protein